MKYKSIIFLVETPILSRYYERYGIELLRNQGFATTIFDLSPLLLPVAYHAITSDLCDYESCGFERIFSLEEFKNSLGKYKDNNPLIICSMGYMWEYRKVFRMIKKYGIDFCYFMQELSPTDNAKINKRWSEKLSLKNLIHAVTRRIPRKFHKVPSAKFVLGCGDDPEQVRTFKNERLCALDCPVYYFHSSNYEECLNCDDKPVTEGEYCVFIDQYIPYHPEIIDARLQINPGEYYAEMNAFFDDIEKEFGIKTVIAAHPRSNYQKHPECFLEREVIKNRTCNLVKYSRFVIYHFSNSLSYVALYKKPVIVATTKEIGTLFKDKIDRVCSVLGTTPVDVTDFLQSGNKRSILENKLTINDVAYNSYVRKYMKKNYNGVLEGERLWEQIGKFLASDRV